MTFGFEGLFGPFPTSWWTLGRFDDRTRDLSARAIVFTSTVEVKIFKIDRFASIHFSSDELNDQNDLLWVPWPCTIGRYRMASGDVPYWACWEKKVRFGSRSRKKRSVWVVAPWDTHLGGPIWGCVPPISGMLGKEGPFGYSHRPHLTFGPGPVFLGQPHFPDRTSFFDLRDRTCFCGAARPSRSDLFFGSARPAGMATHLWEGWISPQKKGSGGDGAPSQMFANLHQVKRLRIRSQNGCVHNCSGSARHCTKWVEQGGGSESGSSFIALLGRGPHKNCKNDLDDQT